MNESARDPRLVPDHERPGSWIVRVGGTDQSYIDPWDPTYLEFDYVQRIADVIDTSFETSERITAIHVGGAGLTIPRYIAHTRPTSGQIVFEPDAGLTQAVRDVAPLPRHSGIKVRPVDGRSGIDKVPESYADLVVVDAFSGARVPAELGTAEWFGHLRRVVRPTGLLIMNLTDHAPFAYSRRVLAGISAHFSPVMLGAEPSTLKGRRFGNMVVAAGPPVDPPAVARRAAAAVFPHRIMCGPELDRWAGHGLPFTDDDAEQSPAPSDSLTTFA